MAVLKLYCIIYKNLLETHVICLYKVFLMEQKYFFFGLSYTRICKKQTRSYICILYRNSNGSLHDLFSNAYNFTKFSPTTSFKLVSNFRECFKENAVYGMTNLFFFLIKLLSYRKKCIFWIDTQESLSIFFSVARILRTNNFSF